MKSLPTLLGCALLALAACSSSKLSSNATSPEINNTTSAVATAQKDTDIVGVWAFVRNTGSPASAEKKIKVIQGKHWMFSQTDPGSNLVIFHHGGSYSLNGKNYAETIEYANPSTGGYLGQTFEYTIKIEGDTMTLEGPYNEVWKRVK